MCRIFASNCNLEHCKPRTCHIWKSVSVALKNPRQRNTDRYHIDFLSDFGSSRPLHINEYPSNQQTNSFTFRLFHKRFSCSWKLLHAFCEGERDSQKTGRIPVDRQTCLHGAEERKKATDRVKNDERKLHGWHNCSSHREKRRGPLGVTKSNLVRILSDHRFLVLRNADKDGSKIFNDTRWRWTFTRSTFELALRWKCICAARHQSVRRISKSVKETYIEASAQSVRFVNITLFSVIVTLLGAVSLTHFLTYVFLC